MERGTLNPHLAESMIAAGEDTTNVEVWGNYIYQCIVRQRRLMDGFGVQVGSITWLSIKTHTRRPIRDWRHLQQIKNEVCGPEREACEIFPAESRLVDTSNEFHLFVLPEGERFPFGYQVRDIAQPEEMEAVNEMVRASGGAGLARQRPWQEGLTTGGGRSDG